MALYMVFIEDVEDKDGERCIMPTSEHLEDMVVLAWQTGAYVFCFVDRAQHHKNPRCWTHLTKQQSCS